MQGRGAALKTNTSKPGSTTNNLTKRKKKAELFILRGLTNKVETGGGQGSAEEKQDSQQTESKIQEQDARGNELTE